LKPGPERSRGESTLSFRKQLEPAQGEILCAKSDIKRIRVLADPQTIRCQTEVGKTSKDITLQGKKKSKVEKNFQRGNVNVVCGGNERKLIGGGKVTIAFITPNQRTKVKGPHTVLPSLNWGQSERTNKGSFGKKKGLAGKWEWAMPGEGKKNMSHRLR